jgi:hypothetical protein
LLLKYRTYPVQQKKSEKQKKKIQSKVSKCVLTSCLKLVLSKFRPQITVKIVDLK